MKMDIEPFGVKHIAQAVQLALENLEAERTHVPALPVGDFAPTLTRLITELAKRCYGVAAVQSGRLAGYLMGSPVNAFKGLNRGVTCPLYAHGAVGDKGSIYQRMYQEIAGVWVRNGCLTHCITLYAHDEPSVAAWFDLAFGKRCIDAIRTLSPVPNARPQPYAIRPAALSDVPRLLPLYNEDAAYFSTSPLFMALPQFYSEEAIVHELQTSRSVWVALAGHMPVGVMKLKPAGESFPSDAAGVMNLYDVYIRPSARNTGLGTAMLAEINNWMAGQGYTHMGVDYESFNLLGARFWSRYFTPYTFSLMRRLDERILWANGERLKEIMV